MKKLIVFLLFISCGLSIAQVRMENLKRAGLMHMQAGRYGEAVDQFNKYISANPRAADGYNLRALSLQNRKDFVNAILDFRRAIRLEPQNAEYQSNLDKAIAEWHEILRNKIVGHKRDIAINPNDPFSYLEIGKSYRWLEEWRDAEIWYDEYLKRDDNASPDEIIRYTEILAKNGSIVKGEKILKIFVERYPEDWRLWSRYGYFTLWLGKYKIAEDAFTKSLGFKPFFKEAQDGLDIAKQQGYLTQFQPRSYEKVYPIDRFYSLLKRTPDNNGIRYDLVRELIKENRYEEAYQQLKIIERTDASSESYIKLMDEVSTFRDSTNENTIDNLTSKLKDNPTDKETVVKLAEAYSNLLYYDSAIEILNEYLQNIPEDQDSDLRFKYAQYSAWNYKWIDATNQINKLLEYDPNNLEYQLLAGQIGVWTVQNIDQSEVYLLNVYNSKPRDPRVVLSLASLNILKKDFPEAKKYLDLVRTLDTKNIEIEAVQNTYDLHLSAYQEEQLYKLRIAAYQKAVDGDCSEALTDYKDYLSKKTNPTIDELTEYAYINSCAGNYGEASDLYSKILDQGYTYDIASARAKNLFWNGDTLSALPEFESLAKLEPDDKETKLYLADSYFGTNQLYKADSLYNYLINDTTDEKYIKDINYRRIFLGDKFVQSKEYGEAEDIYDDVSDITKDTAQISMVRQRLEWLPPSGFSKGITSLGYYLAYLLPTNIGLSPFSNVFKDNQDLLFYNYGLSLDAGFVNFLSLGFNWTRSRLENSNYHNDFTSFKGRASIFFSKYFTASASYGPLNIRGEAAKNIGDLMIKYEVPDQTNISGYYENTDTRLLLYSPFLVGTRSKIEMYRLSIQHVYRDLLKIYGYYSYYFISDKNEGNDLLFRIGRRFLVNGFFGYEFNFIDFAYITPLYYSPDRFSSHSIWGEGSYKPIEKMELVGFAKIGYVPSVDFIIGEISGEFRYKPWDFLSLFGKITYSQSYRYDGSYRSLSGSLSAYIGIF